jgi:cytochrome b
MAMSVAVAAPAQRTLVWDLPTRLSHWGLAIAVTGAWLTGEFGPIDKTWHMRFGYAALVIVAFRLLWGFVGGHHARFAALLPKLKGLWGYLRTVPRREPSAHAGHNPLGVLSVIALLVVVAVQAVTGLFADDDIFARGPLATMVSGATRSQLTSIHVQLQFVVAGLVLLHLAAIAYYALWKGSDLAKAMVTGRKTVPAEAPDVAVPTDKRRGPVWLAACLVLGLSATLWAVITYLPPPPSSGWG